MSKLNLKRKEAILKKLLPPHNQPVSLIAKEEQLNKSTLYTWLKQARDQYPDLYVILKSAGSTLC
ncbi:hypothetical protein [Thiomicrospira microaerophila]|uniref:hypothetical protein n=1 Tax=Thiomicrospira microaerophila TaxID=406020 RepID=UPI0005CA6A8E|nr:hypothetical protein [Thiomicrospira microaerophila]